MKNMLCLWIAAIGTAAICFLSPAAAAGPVHVRAAVLKNFPPQYSLSKTGKPQGFAVDVMEAIARLADFNIEYMVLDNWQEMHDALESGKADLIPNMGITERRKEWVAFSLPVETFPVSLFVRIHEKEISSAKRNLAGKRIAVVRLNIGEVEVKKFPEVTVQPFNHMEDALFSLLSGNTDAMIFPEPVLFKAARQARIDDKIKVAGPPLIEISRGIGVHKSNTQLLDRINAAVSRFIGSDSYRGIYTRWYGKPTPFWTVRKVTVLLSSLLFSVFSIMLIWRYRSMLTLNRRLSSHVEKLTHTEAELKKIQDNLEQMVEERTIQLKETVNDLQTALAEVEQLSGLLPICARCNKIRDDKGYWNRLESYIEKHSRASFSHGICPDCQDALYGKESWYIKMKPDKS